MKRTFITAFFAMLLALITVSCHSDDNEIGYADLPTTAQLFVKQYFADATYSTLPAGIIPAAILADIAKRYPDLKPYKVEKEIGGYEIDIPGFDLYYSYNGEFIRAEIDR